MIANNQGKVSLFKSDYKPFRFYKGANQLGGWINQTKQGNDLTFNNTYKNDNIDLTVLGKTEFKSKYRETNNITVGDYKITTDNAVYTFNMPVVIGTNDILIFNEIDGKGYCIKDGIKTLLTFTKVVNSTLPELPVKAFGNNSVNINLIQNSTLIAQNEYKIVQPITSENSKIKLNLTADNYTLSYKLKCDIGTNYRFVVTFTDGTTQDVYKPSTGEYQSFLINISNTKQIDYINLVFSSAVGNVYIKDLILIKGIYTEATIVYEPFNPIKPLTDPSIDYPFNFISLQNFNIICENSDKSKQITASVTTPLNELQTADLISKVNNVVSYIKNNEILTLTGTENFGGGTAVGTGTVLQFSLPLQAKDRIALCSHFKYINDYSETEHIVFSSTAQTLYFHVLKSRLATPDVAGFKAFLTQQNTNATPIKILYSLPNIVNTNISSTSEGQSLLKLLSSEKSTRIYTNLPLTLKATLKIQN